MRLSGGDPRETLLAAAWDEAAALCPLPGFPSLSLRPFSANALRRAETMGLRCLGGDFRRVLAALPPGRALHEIEALAWLLAAPLEEVLAAMRTRSWETALDGWELPRAALAPFRAEMVRVLGLVRAAMFTAEAKPDPPLPAGRRRADEPDPPAHLLHPGTVATLAFALAEKYQRSADELLEWVPVCQVFQLAHCQQWGNTRIWTVDPGGPDPAADPLMGAAPEPDPGFGEDIAF